VISPGKPAPIDFRQIDAVLFDLGGTLVSMDFAWIARELLGLDVSCDSARLARAEASVRRLVSAKLAEKTPPAPIFPFFLRSILTQVLDEPAAGNVDELVSKLVPVLLPEGKGQQLWSSVDAATRDALNEFSRLGLRMAVVSNSDGTAEAGVKAMGLRDFFEVVIDSAVVGYEKPDPRIFQCALEALSVAADRAIYVGDLYSVDVLGARAAGIHPVLLDPHGDWGEVDCLTVSNLAELVTMFQLTPDSRT
jgi:putative hydrolase of the HAD superfamily